MNSITDFRFSSSIARGQLFTYIINNIELSGNESGTTTRLLAGLFESVVSIVDQHGDDLTRSFGDAAVQAVVQSLNKVCLLSPKNFFLALRSNISFRS